MIRAYKYKLKPTVKQQHMLSQAFGNARFIYNWGLNRKKESWEKEKKNIGYVQLAKELTELKKDSEHSWLNNCACESLQQSLRSLDSAYTRFFKAKKGFPKFKSKKNKHDSVKFVNNIKVNFDTMLINIPRVGKVKFLENRVFESDAKLGTLTVTRDRCGDYWYTIVVDDGKPNIPKAKVCEETAVGIDLGIKDYAILSDGTKYGNPKFLEKGQKRLAGLQQGLSKKANGSKNYEKQRIRVARQHRKIANRRIDFIHKLTTDLVRRFDTICVENLDVKGMMESGTHILSNAIASTAWSEFKRQIEYKSEMYGKNVILIGRFEPSSKTCHKCGYVNKDLTLGDREWVCPVCGEHHDRDVNAAQNIKTFALHPQAQVGFERKLGKYE